MVVFYSYVSFPEGNSKMMENHDSPWITLENLSGKPMENMENSGTALWITSAWNSPETNVFKR